MRAEARILQENLEEELGLHSSWLGQRLYSLSRKQRWLKRCLKPLLPQYALVSLDNLRLAVDPRDERGPSFHLSYGGEEGFRHYEVPQKQEILSWLPREGGVYFDVGANIGPIAFFLKRQLPMLAVYAFEADPMQAKLFRASILLNQLPGMEIEAAAVGQQTGTADLIQNASDAGGNSLLPETIRAEDRANRVRVPLLSLDDFVFTKAAEKISRLDVIKLDVQGAENDVLWGARDLLRRFLPVLLIEGENQRISEKGDLVAPLRNFSLGYQVRLLEENDWFSLDDLPARATEERRRGRIFTDYVFVNEARRSNK